MLPTSIMNTLAAILITYLFSADSSSATPTDSGALNWHLPHLSTFSPYTPPKHHFKSLNPPTCRLQQVQVISRHGERYPEWYQMDGMEELQDRLRYLASNYTIASDYQETLRHYDIGFRLKFAGYLAETGKQNLIQIGRRAAARYQGLVQNGSELYLQTSDKGRCHNSSAAFLSGFFNMDFEFALKEENRTTTCVSPRPRDADLNAFQACSLWDKTKIKSSSQAIEDAKKHLVSIAKKHVASTLQLDESQFSKSDVSTLYTLCAFHAGLAPKQNQNMPLECALLGPEGIKAMSHYKDIKDYEEFGYARKINKDMQCSLLIGIRDHMIKRIRNETGAKRLVVRYAHEETMLPLMTAFGLFYDNETTLLTSNRQWKPSHFAGFCGNAMIELYECEQSSWKLRLLVNEVPQAIPGCSEEGDLLCPVDKFLDLTGAWATCRFDEMCKNKKPSSGSWNRFSFLKN